MKNSNFFIAILLVMLISSCGSKTQNPNALFSLEISGGKKAISATEKLEVTVKSKKGNVIEEITYSLDGEKVTASAANEKKTFSLDNISLGSKNISAIIKSDGQTYVISENITVLSPVTPKVYTYKILETYPHDINAYTQGLEFVGDVLYEGTGQYGSSSLRKTNYKTGEVLVNKPLDNQYFGEGITVFNDKLYQLTWRENTGIIYNLETLEKTGTFAYNKSKEGWGLCNDGTKLYKSDGTEKIWTLNATTLAEESNVEIYTNKSKIKAVNELEWVDGMIYANIYKRPAIAIVNPSNGAVHGVIDLKGLKKKVTQHNKLDVLNGIAYKGEPNIIYVTGKNWDKLFKIEIIEN